jgi:hypothetical protein
VRDPSITLMALGSNPASTRAGLWVSASPPPAPAPRPPCPVHSGFGLLCVFTARLSPGPWRLSLLQSFSALSPSQSTAGHGWRPSRLRPMFLQVQVQGRLCGAARLPPAAGGSAPSLPPSSPGPSPAPTSSVTVRQSVHLSVSPCGIGLGPSQMTSSKLHDIGKDISK